ncbi:MAG: cyclase family protein [Desulfobacterales bacterium]
MLAADRRLIDLSHTVAHGLVTYRGLPAPVISEYLSRDASRSHYAPGTSFQIGRIDMVANTGTYIDAPFHRFADGNDLAQLELATLAGLDGAVFRVPPGSRAIGPEHFQGPEVTGKAVLIHTGWDRHWGGRPISKITPT